MITVRVKYTDPTSHSRVIARVTAESIARALVLVPGEVVFPIPDDAFANYRKGVVIERTEA